MKKGIRILAGLLLVLAGCMCFMYPNYREWKTQREVEAVIDSFTQEESAGAQGYVSQASTADTEAVEGGGAKCETEAVDGSGTEGTDAAEETWQAETTAQSEVDDVPSEVSVAAAKADYSKLPELYKAMQAYNAELINGQSITDAWTYEQTPVEFPDIDRDSPVIGYIEIPDMDIRLPLYVGASAENLEKGAAILSGTSMPVGGINTNCVIAGHRGWQGSAYFQYIEDLGPGSKVYIATPWETLVYEFREVKITTPDDIGSVLIQEGKDMITLLTCHPYQVGGGPFRYLVYCDRVTEKGAVAETAEETGTETGMESVTSPVTGETTEDGENKETAESARAQTADQEGIQGNLSQADAWAGADGIDLIAIEQALRVLLPCVVIAFAGFTILSRLFPKKRKKGTKNTKNIKKSAKNQRKPDTVPKIGKKHRPQHK